MNARRILKVVDGITRTTGKSSHEIYIKMFPAFGSHAVM